MKIRGEQIADNPVLSGVAGMVIPTGATSDRPAAPVAGTLRGNMTLGTAEMYIGGQWVSFAGAMSSVVLQASRSTTYTMTTTATEITLDTVDVASNSAILYRDDTNTARLYAAVAGLYEVEYCATLVETDNGTTDTLYASKNGTSTILRSTCAIRPRSATATMVRKFYVQLASNDYISIMGSKSRSSGNGVVQVDLTVCMRKI